MTNKKEYETLQKLAKEIIESHTGFKTSYKDFTLLESGTNKDGKVDYIQFIRFGFPNIIYTSHLVNNSYDLRIDNKKTLESLDI